jgi:hypothetical protein
MQRAPKLVAATALGPGASASQVGDLLNVWKPHEKRRAKGIDKSAVFEADALGHKSVFAEDDEDDATPLNASWGSLLFCSSFFQFAAVLLSSTLSLIFTCYAMSSAWPALQRSDPITAHNALIILTLECCVFVLTILKAWVRDYEKETLATLLKPSSEKKPWLVRKLLTRLADIGVITALQLLIYIFTGMTVVSFGDHSGGVSRLIVTIWVVIFYVWPFLMGTYIVGVAEFRKIHMVMIALPYLFGMVFSFGVFVTNGHWTQTLVNERTSLATASVLSAFYVVNKFAMVFFMGGRRILRVIMKKKTKKLLKLLHLSVYIPYARIKLRERLALVTQLRETIEWLNTEVSRILQDLRQRSDISEEEWDRNPLVVALNEFLQQRQNVLEQREQALRDLDEALTNAEQEIVAEARAITRLMFGRGAISEVDGEDTGAVDATGRVQNAEHMEEPLLALEYDDEDPSSIAALRDVDKSASTAVFEKGFEPDHQSDVDFSEPAASDDSKYAATRDDTDSKAADKEPGAYVPVHIKNERTEQVCKCTCGNIGIWPLWCVLTILLIWVVSFPLSSTGETGAWACFPGCPEPINTAGSAAVILFAVHLSQVLLVMLSQFIVSGERRRSILFLVMFTIEFLMSLSMVSALGEARSDHKAYIDRVWNSGVQQTVLAVAIIALLYSGLVCFLIAVALVRDCRSSSADQDAKKREQDRQGPAGVMPDAFPRISLLYIFLGVVMFSMILVGIGPAALYPLFLIQSSNPNDNSYNSNQGAPLLGPTWVKVAGVDANGTQWYGHDTVMGLYGICERYDCYYWVDSSDDNTYASYGSTTLLECEQSFDYCPSNRIDLLETSGAIATIVYIIASMMFAALFYTWLARTRFGFAMVFTISLFFNRANIYRTAERIQKTSVRLVKYVLFVFWIGVIGALLTILIVFQIWLEAQPDTIVVNGRLLALEFTFQPLYYATLVIGLIIAPFFYFAGRLICIRVYCPSHAD